MLLTHPVLYGGTFTPGSVRERRRDRLLRRKYDNGEDLHRPSHDDDDDDGRNGRSNYRAK